MPYTSQSNNFPKISWFDSIWSETEGSPIERVYSGDFPEKKFTRDGTNAYRFRDFKKSPPKGHFVEVFRLADKGPRLAYKVLDRRTGKWRWARQTVLVRRLVFVRDKQSKNSNRFITKPNRLNFREYSCTKFSEGVSRATDPSRPSFGAKVSGDFWAMSYLFGTSLSSPGPNPQNYTGNGFSPAATALVTKLDNLALSALRERVKNQAVNLAQAFAERRQTVETITQLAQRVAKGLLQAKKGNISGAMKTLLPGDPKAVANDWLVLQYGLKPIISDIVGALTHISEEEPGVYDIRLKRSEKIPVSNLNFKETWACACETSVTEFGSVEVTYKVKLAAKPSVLRQFNRLGFANLLSLSWELLPYSFVIDWALPIGDYLNGLDAFSGVELLHVHKTVVVRETVHYERRFGGTDRRGWVWSEARSGFTIKKTTVDRTVLSEHDLRNPLPEFKDPVSTGHILNALALFVQLKKA